ncbi:MAG: radical SAM protein [Verrucomicrobia bacterium]|jgi:anaerobic magnesium-protoporphyrin IX monomethyl ester cyclase|nr:radical SAM protein [Verrucomicrobiota bacterium]MBT7068239.1 radical SAM protein [Verrucomicrobiota bacterium]MBT7699625.1 radical SAM protein [Verrucomicrobiota bacterium]
MKRVLLLNPPADPPVSRDYYCGHFTKGRYYWPQIDLLVMSGMLAGHYEVQVLDAVVEDLTPDETHARIAALSPDAVVAVTASVSWSGDMAFLSRLKETHPLPILVSGDYPRAEPQAVLAHHPAIDAVVLDFTENDAVAFIGGKRGPGLRNLYTRTDSGEPQIEGSSVFCYPTPRHELFPLKRYYMPQSLHHPAVPILTDFGCPFACDFCFMERVQYRLRDMADVTAELAALRKLGVRELFLADQSFGSHATHAREVCQTIRDVGRGRFTWAASMRVDAATPELLQVMRDAGCHTLMFGVETPSQEVLDAHHKRTTVDQIQVAFALARKMGFRRLAHFIIGLTGEDEASLERLVEFAIALDPDIASFNVAAPAWNTSFGDHIRDESWQLGEGVEIAGPDAAPVWEQPGLPIQTILRLRDQAVRRFYMRPGYILKQLTRVRSTYQLRTLFREGIGMLRDRMGS